MVDVPTAVRVAVVAALLASTFGAVLVGRAGDLPRRLRSRLLLGVPWGTLVLLAVVLAVYLVVQRGLVHWNNPLSIPFVSWTYLYPTGWLLAPFAHSGPGHLLGNVLSTVVLGTLAEYAWSHYPVRRGSAAFEGWRSNPYVRAFGLFPAGAVLAGYATVLLHWGPVIGFSGVVFAFAGFALVRYPLVTVVALVARGLVTLLYRAFEEPVVEATAGSVFSTPWWAGVAIQGHLLGALVGVGGGLLLMARRDEGPRPLRLWVGTLLFGSSLTLWAVWWFRGGNRYVLHRGLGVVLLFGLALLVTIVANASDRPLALGVSRRTAARLLFLLPLLVMLVVAVPVNLTAVTGAPPGEHVTAGDYTVTYATDVPNQRVSVVNVSVFNESTAVRTSGVIVVSERRGIWYQVLSPEKLDFFDRRTVHLGGPRTLHRVTARREGWSVVGNDTVYQVWLRANGGEWRHVYATDESTARPVIAGRNVTLVPSEGEFELAVSRNGTRLDRVPIPEPGGNATAAGLKVVRRVDHLVAVRNGTRVRVASAGS